MQSTDSDAATGVTTFGTAPSKPAKKKLTSDTKKFLAVLYKIMMPPALSVRKIGIDSYNARLQPSLMGGLEAGPKAGVAAEQKTGLEHEIDIPYSLVVGWTLLMLGVTLKSGAKVPLLVGMAVLLVVRVTIEPEAAWKAGLVAGVAAGLAAGLEAGVVVGMAAVLLFVVAAGLRARLENGVVAVLVIEMVAGLMVGVVGGLVAGVAVTAAVGVAAGLVAGMAAGLKAGLKSGVTTGLEAALNAAWKTGVMAGVVAGLVVGVVAGLKAGVAATAAVGVTAGLMVGVAAGLKAGVVAGLVAGVMVGLMVGLAVGLKFGLEAGVTAGLKATEAAELVVGVAYVLLVEVVVLLVVGVTAVMIVGVTTGLETEVTTVLAAVLAAGLLAGVWAGLKTVLQAARKAGKLRQCEGSRTLPSFLPDQISKTSKATQLADVKEEQDWDCGALKSCRLEEDVDLHYDPYTKNPGHEGLIPSDEFNLENLPLRWKDRDIFRYNCSLRYITVRVTVEYVSDRRPSTCAVSGKPYPGYLFRGQRRTTVGTGWVLSVHMFPGKHNSQCQTCPCQDCCVSSTPVRQFAFIDIYTAAHVVFDDIEGEHCTCHLFYDRGGLPETCKGVVQLIRMWRVFPDTSTDCCLMIHVTHDMHLAARLDRMVSHYHCLKENYINKCLLSCPPNVAQTEQNSLVVLVSHPHGCSSNVSLGVAMDSQVNEAGITHYMYGTPTCPGSSGVKKFLKWKDWRMWGLEHTHNGGSNQGDQLNYSSHGVGSLPHTYLQVGAADVQEYFPETDLHSSYMECDKNPGHEKFTPMHQFSEKHLPAEHRHLVEPIKALGKIVALAAVKRVSEDRPQTFPGSNKRNPVTSCVGTAWVYKVFRFPNTSGIYMGKCTCGECRISGDPKTEFAHIIIHTAAHVVFNEFEGEHTTCYLFYDEGDTVEGCEGVVKLSGMSRVWSDAEKDVCKMLYVTHDPDVIDRVETAVNEWESARKSVELMDKIKSTSLQGSLSAGASHQSLAIAVSHPHGCSKQVSIGHCVSTDDKGKGHTVYIDNPNLTWF